MNKPNLETIESQRVVLSKADLEAACAIPAGTMELISVRLDPSVSPETVTVVWTTVKTGPPVTT